jgi:acetyl-CoA C-acetyltransferase
MPGSLIVAGSRTPIGKLSGALAGFSATQLGSIAIKASLERANVTPEQIDHVIMGQVVLAGTGQVPARQAALGAGISRMTPAITLNKACLSGLNAIYLADLMIQNGDADIVVAGGQESMTNAPHLLLGARQGYRIGHTEVKDALMYDGLEDAVSHDAMGLDSERYMAQFPAVTRRRQDEFAAESHERAARATKDGLFAEEIIQVEIPHRKDDSTVLADDEGIRPGTTAESLASLRTAFAPNGTLTAGNSSQISDGASAVIVMSEGAASRAGVDPLGRIVSYGMISGPSTCLMTQPSRATLKALAKTDLDVRDVRLFEFNEAFAAVSLGSVDDLSISPEIVNVNGGAIALGHPVGASGNRIALTLLHELHRRGGGYGVAALCGGGGQGDALVVKVGEG